MLILWQGLWHWRLSQTPLWGLALLLPPKAVLGIGSGVTTTCLMGVLPQGHPCSRVPSPVSQLQQHSETEHSPCSRCHPPGLAESGSPLPAPSEAADPHALAGPPHLPAPPHDVFLEQHLGLEPPVAAFGLFCQIIEPGMLQALVSTHPSTGGKRSLRQPCLSPSPPTAPFSSHSRAPKSHSPAGRNQTEGWAQVLAGLGRTPKGPTHPAWDRCPWRDAGLCWGQSERGRVHSVQDSGDAADPGEEAACGTRGCGTWGCPPQDPMATASLTPLILDDEV